MTKVIREVLVNAYKENIWEILANLESVQQYDPGVTAARYLTEAKEGVDAARHCDLVDGDFVKERITAWSPEEGYSIAVYEGGNAFAPFQSQEGRFILTDAQGGTAVRMELTYQLQPDVPGEREIEAQMGELVAGTLSGLKHYAETGQPVEPRA